MKSYVSLEEQVRKLVAKDPRYNRLAYEFIYNALTHTVSKTPGERHVSGQDLSRGIREYALQEFGPMAREVLNYWGLKTTDDFGEVVYNLIEIEVLGSSEGDRREDFHDVFSLDGAFEEGFNILVADEDLNL